MRGFFECLNTRSRSITNSGSAFLKSASVELLPLNHVEKTLSPLQLFKTSHHGFSEIAMCSIFSPQVTALAAIFTNLHNSY